MPLSALLAVATLGIQQFGKPTLPFDLQFLAPLKPKVSSYEPKAVNADRLLLLQAVARRQQLLKSHLESDEVIRALDKRIDALRALEQPPQGNSMYRLDFANSRQAVEALLRRNVAKPMRGGNFVLRSGTHGIVYAAGKHSYIIVTEPLQRLAH